MRESNQQKPKILLITEDIKLQDYIALILIGEGYDIAAYTSGEELLRNINKESFDLIIIEFLSEHIDGLNICKTIRETFLLRQTPVIIILPNNDPLNKAKAIYSGADDYIEKDNLSEELLLRVKTALWRVYRYRDVNPITKLPGISTALKELDKLIKTNKPIAVGYAELYKFRRFNDRYGFSRGDDVIKHTASIIKEALIELGTSSDFLAHFGGDDFVFITLPESIEEICKKIIKDFDETIISFYDEEDKKRKGIVMKNRQGGLTHYPLLRISIGALTSENYPLTETAQVLEVTQELKNYAKKFDKSIYVKERRRSYPFY